MAGWISPEQCTSNCCGPPTPCPPPIVTCRLYVDGYGGGSGFLAYTVENADTAWVRQTCNDGTTIDFPLTLTGGAASGNYTPINDEDCEYVVFAENSCSTVVAYCECVVPWCSLGAERVVSSSDFRNFESVRLRWRYRSRNPSVIVGGNPIVSAEISGIGDVFNGQPHEDTGDEFVLEPVDLQESYTLTVTNECGEVVTCTVFIPCCWRQTATVLQISPPSDSVSGSCVNTAVEFVPRAIDVIRVFNREGTFEITGISSIAGTHILNMAKFDCTRFEPYEEILLGSVTVRSTSRTDYEVFQGALAGLHFSETEYEATYDIYLKENQFGERDVPFATNGFLVNRLQDGTHYIKETYSEFPARNFDNVACKADGNAFNRVLPPCPTAPLSYDLQPLASGSIGAGCGFGPEIPPDSGRIESNLWLYATSEISAPCALGSFPYVFANVFRSEWL